ASSGFARRGDPKSVDRAAWLRSAATSTCSSRASLASPRPREMNSRGAHPRFRGPSPKTFLSSVTVHLARALNEPNDPIERARRRVVLLAEGHEGVDHVALDVMRDLYAGALGAFDEAPSIVGQQLC